MANVSKLLHSLFRPRFRQSLTSSQVKTLLRITTRKSHILSINSSTRFFSPRLPPTFFLSFFHRSPTPLLSSSLFTRCPSVCVSYATLKADWHTEAAKSSLALVFVCQSRDYQQRVRRGAFIWQHMATQRRIFSMKTNDETKSKQWWGFLTGYYRYSHFSACIFIADTRIQSKL